MQVGVKLQQPLNLVHLFEANGLDVRMDVDVRAVAMQHGKSDGSICRGSAQSAIYFGDHQVNNPPQFLESGAILAHTLHATPSVPPIQGKILILHRLQILWGTRGQ